MRVVPIVMPQNTTVFTTEKVANPEIQEILEDIEEQRLEQEPEQDIERRQSISSIRTTTIEINIPNSLNVRDYMYRMNECMRTTYIGILYLFCMLLMFSVGPLFYVAITCFKKRSTFEIQGFMGSILVCSIFWFVVGKFLM